MEWEDIFEKAGEISDGLVDSMLNGKDSTGLSDEGQRMADKISEENYLSLHWNERKGFDGRKAFGRMKRNENRKRVMRVALWTTGVAACIAIVLILVFPRHSAVYDSAPMAANEFPAASMKARLICADGKEMVLGSSMPRMQTVDGAMVAVDSNGLEYAADSEVAAEEGLMNRLIVPRGGIYLLTLSDGTRIWMNADSWLEYPVHFSGKSREVRLGGEAYFAVARNEECPFIVHTAAGRVKVLGTEFNVKCYEDDHLLAATLVSGKVNYSNPHLPPVDLRPGEQLVWDSQHMHVSVEEVNVNHFIGWKDSRLTFQKEKLGEIMKVLGRWYDIEVVFQNEHLRELEFSGNLDKFTDIRTFLRLFALGADVMFDIKGDTVFVNARN